VLESVDAELGRGERLGPMRGRGRHDDRDLSYFEPPHSVEKGQSTDLWPAGPSGGRHGSEPWHDMLFIGLVFQRCHTGPPVGMITYGAAERDNASTFGDAGPPPGGVDRELALTDGNPVLADRYLQLGLRHEGT
jgi:hypothetical protein